MYQSMYVSPIGTLKIESCDHYIRKISYVHKEQEEMERTHPIIDFCKKELDSYFRGEIQSFQSLFDPQGSDFSRSVWNELTKIPYGETKAYSEIASLVGMPKAQRAVGMANRNNPILLMIPCHRVIGKHGNLGGFAAGGVENKKFLLSLEKKFMK